MREFFVLVNEYHWTAVLLVMAVCGVIAALKEKG